MRTSHRCPLLPKMLSSSHIPMESSPSFFSRFDTICFSSSNWVRSGASSFRRPPLGQQNEMACWPGNKLAERRQLE
jgi:hypothetical protein